MHFQQIVEQHAFVAGGGKLVAPALVFAASTAASMCYKISEVAEQKLDFDCGNLHTSLVIGTMLLAGGAFAATFYR